MDYLRRLQPRNIYYKAVSLAWGYLGTELKPVSYDLPQTQLSDFSIEWPTSLGWSLGLKWCETIRAGLQRYITVRDIDIPQPPDVTAICLWLNHHGIKHKVVIDYSDDHQIILGDYLKDCLLYFKMQFRNEGYNDPRIVPGLYVPSAALKMYRFLPKLREIRDKSTRFEVYGRFGLYSEEDIRRGQLVRGDGDQKARSIRANAINVLTRQKRFHYQGGKKLVQPLRSLIEAAKSKICIDLPGRGPFCFRLVDYLSIGSCIVAYPHKAALYPELVNGKHIVYCRPDLSDIVDICEYYLTHDRQRREMIEASRQFFDEYLHKDRLAVYYIEALSTRLNGG